MGLFVWVQSLFAPEELRMRKTPLRAPAAREEPSDSVDAEPDPALPKSAERRPNGIGNLDREMDCPAELEAAQRALLERIGAKLESGRFGFPLLPMSATAALAVANRPDAEVRHLVEVIERDPLLTGEVLRIANSALYSMKFPATKLQEAVMRIGLRSVRGVLYSAVMKNDLVQGSALTEYAQEVWRQSQSVARIARAIGGQLGFEAESAHVVGLLHDIGKVALLGVLQSELRGEAPTPQLVGRVFRDFHEHAGRVMALAWKLPDELVAVIGCHHDFAANAAHRRAAALVWLAHQIDLRLSIGADEGYRALADSEAFDELGTAPDARWEILDHARHLWESAEEALAMRA